MNVDSKERVSGENRDPVFWRVVCFLACIPSGGALLAKLYGLASMQTVTLLLVIPGCLLLVAVWRWARVTGRDSLADALAIGAVGGLLGTFGYDIVRVPFVLAGQRIFAPISAYGIWITDASTWSPGTEVMGWAYHFSNGITFGVMYALWMRGRHWLWAIAWAFLLETIALVSPFTVVFGMVGDFWKIGIAYMGHVAYGLPLGWLVMRWDETRDWLRGWTPTMRWVAAALGVVALFSPLLSPELRARNARAEPGVFRVEGRLLNPAWLRIEPGDPIRIENPEGVAASVQIVQLGRALTVPPEGSVPLTLQATGVYQVYVATLGRSRSSFVIVDPVEDLARNVGGDGS